MLLPCHYLSLLVVRLEMTVIVVLWLVLMEQWRCWSRWWWWCETNKISEQSWDSRTTIYRPHSSDMVKQRSASHDIVTFKWIEKSPPDIEASSTLFLAYPNLDWKRNPSNKWQESKFKAELLSYSLFSAIIQSRTFRLYARSILRLSSRDSRLKTWFNFTTSSCSSSATSLLQRFRLNSSPEASSKNT